MSYSVEIVVDETEIVGRPLARTSCSCAGAGWAAQGIEGHLETDYLRTAQPRTLLVRQSEP